MLTPYHTVDHHGSALAKVATSNIKLLDRFSNCFCLRIRCPLHAPLPLLKSTGQNVRFSFTYKNHDDRHYGKRTVYVKL